eukprot:3891822-Pyramimonas_sp.AAC.1
MSDGGRRVPRPFALAQTGRTLRFCRQVQGNLHTSPRRWLCAPGALASPAARPPETAVDPAAWPPQHMSAHHILSFSCTRYRRHEQLALNSELVDTCVT